MGEGVVGGRGGCWEGEGIVEGGRVNKLSGKNRLIVGVVGE